jgi:hypothetical protein
LDDCKWKLYPIDQLTSRNMARTVVLHEPLWNGGLGMLTGSAGVAIEDQIASGGLMPALYPQRSASAVQALADQRSGPAGLTPPEKLP